MKINPLKLSVNRSLVAMALAVTPGLPILGQSEPLPEGPHPSVAEGHRSAYFKDGEIHVTVLGAPKGKQVWFAYPRWTRDQSAIMYQAGGALYLYDLKTKKTIKVSTADSADYRYPHGEATPK